MNNNQLLMIVFSRKPHRALLTEAFHQSAFANWNADWPIENVSPAGLTFDIVMTSYWFCRGVCWRDSRPVTAGWVSFSRPNREGSSGPPQMIFFREKLVWNAVDSRKTSSTLALINIKRILKFSSWWHQHAHAPPAHRSISNSNVAKTSSAKTTEARDVI